MQDISAAESVFRAIADDAKEFSVILMDREGRIEFWNAGARLAFGYEASEVIGRHFAMLFTATDREHHIPEKELADARTKGRGEDTRWHLRKDGSLFFADGVTSPVRDEAGGVAGFCKIQRDITERYQTEARLAAQLALTNVLSEEQPFEATARRIMQTICEHLAWDIGALWQVLDGMMRCADIWFAPHVNAAAARILCEQQRLARGVGLPGVVWESGEAVWVAKVEDSTRFPRAPLAERAGMRSAFAFPIVTHGEVVGVMEFFSARQRQPEQALLPVMTLIGAQIGDYLERHRTLQALRESEERYRVVSETAQDAIFTIDEDSRILFCNPAVERVFGFEPQELTGKPLDIVIPERFREAHRRGISRYIRTHQKRIPWNGVTLTALRKDGTEFACEIAFGSWETGRGTIFTGFARDITERNRAREELQNSLAHEQQARAEAESARAQLERRADEEAAFRHLASALTGAIEMNDVLHEITNRATHVTRADGVYVERIAVVNAQPVVEVVASAGRGAPPRGLRVGYPGSLTEEILRNRMPVILADMLGFGRSMAPYLADTCEQCEVLVTPLVAEDEPLGALVLLNSKASGRQFRDADVVRARTLGDLTSLALRRVRLLEQERAAKEKAEAAVRVRDETLGIVSHDLRNPLTKIRLSAELLLEATPEEQRELIDTISSASKQMERLIQDLLDVARLEAGRFSVNKVMLEPEPIVVEACASNEPIAQQKQLELIAHVHEPLPKICADRDRLVQVFANLIGNAIKFTPERGSIHIEAAPRDGVVEFSVRDTGPGIPEADIRNVFRPYWQAKKTAHMGAGLGLAIVRGIVEAHGGKVWAENAPGGGALFRFTIPVV